MKKISFQQFVNILLFGVLFTASVINTTSAEELNIKWRPLSIYDNSTIKAKFSTSSNGFDLFITNNDLKRTFWFIQAISESHIELLEKQYVIKFEALSNQDFTLYSRLGEEDVADGNSYVDHKWPIVGDGNWHTHDLEFTGRKITNFLYFQVGKALPGTNLKIRNISISFL